MSESQEDLTYFVDGAGVLADVELRDGGADRYRVRRGEAGLFQRRVLLKTTGNP